MKRRIALLAALLLAGCSTTQRAVQPGPLLVNVASEGEELLLPIDEVWTPIEQHTKAVQIQRPPIEYYQALAVRCAREVTQDKAWQRWASAWLDGRDRSRESAKAAWLAVARRSSPAAYASLACAASDPNAVFVAAFQSIAEACKVRPLDMARLAREAGNDR